MIPEFNFKLAQAAHAGTSFESNERAKQEHIAFIAVTTEAQDQFKNVAAENTNAITLAYILADQFRDGYLARLNKLFHSQSRTYSAMISGPSNYPARRMQKRFNVVDKRRHELIEWAEAFRARAVKEIRASLPGDVKDAAALDRYRREFTNSVGVCKEIDAGNDTYDRSLFVNSIAGKIERAPRSLQPRLLALLRELQAGMARPVITDRHSIWKLETAAPEAPAATGCEVEDLAGGICIERDHDTGRVRIMFPGKPDDTMRTRLKGAGWKWSPRSGAWQRMDTDASMQSARYLAGLAVKPAEVSQ